MVYHYEINANFPVEQNFGKEGFKTKLIFLLDEIKNFMYFCCVILHILLNK